MSVLYYAAIDFGTTFTGLAFTATGSDKVEFKLKWPGAPEGYETKTPTTALFDSQRNFQSFGFEAKEKFSKLDEKKKKTWYYFERFKMQLHSEEVSKT